ncbi:MAG: hypothetical protein WKG32_10420 [Gemmatimonadaceae bacterium]
MKLRSITTLMALGAMTAVAACGDDDDPVQPPQQFAQVRVVNASSTASVGLFANGTAVTGSTVALAAGSATCVNVPIGRSLSFRAAGSSTELATIATPLTANTPYTIVYYGNAQTAVLSDAGFTDPTTGNNGLRFFNATGTAGDIFVTAPNGTLGTASVPNLAAGTATPGASAFGTFPTASTQVRVFNVGTTTGTPRVNFTLPALTGNRAATVFLTGNAATPAFVVQRSCS